MTTAMSFTKNIPLQVCVDDSVSDMPTFNLSCGDLKVTKHVVVDLDAYGFAGIL